MAYRSRQGALILWYAPSRPAGYVADRGEEGPVFGASGCHGNQTGGQIQAGGQTKQGEQGPPLQVWPNQGADKGRGSLEGGPRSQDGCIYRRLGLPVGWEAKCADLALKSAENRDVPYVCSHHQVSLGCDPVFLALDRHQRPVALVNNDSRLFHSRLPLHRLAPGTVDLCSPRRAQEGTDLLKASKLSFGASSWAARAGTSSF
jgi:hypothetical protein